MNIKKSTEKTETIVQAKRSYTTEGDNGTSKFRALKEEGGTIRLDRPLQTRGIKGKGFG